VTQSRRKLHEGRTHSDRGKDTHDARDGLCSPATDSQGREYGGLEYKVGGGWCSLVKHKTQVTHQVAVL